MAERGADPTLIIELANELQKRIGLLPLVKVDAYALPNESGTIYRIMRIQPSSISEISRVIRAARTMKLHIRCIGMGSSLNKSILMNDFSVVLDLRNLSDSERIERVVIRMKDMSCVEGIRVLAGVTINELCQYQIQNHICVPTNTEAIDRTVVGVIISGSNGAVTNAQSSLADYVLQVRILDIHGEIQTYTDTSSMEFSDCYNTIKLVISGLGLLGVVYDVVLKYDMLKTVKVNYEFITIENLFSNMGNLKEKIDSQMSTQLIYIPFNSVECFQNSEVKLDKWWCKNDEIIIRTMNETDAESEMRQYITIPDENQGCLDSLLRESHLTPLILKASHQSIRRKFIQSTNQYLPWAIHCFPVISTGFHDVTISTCLGNMINFEKAFRVVLDKIEYFAHNLNNFSVNGGVKVNFTNGTNVALCPGQKGLDSDKSVHIKLLGVLFSPGWKDLIFTVIDEIMRMIPSAVLQWSSEWIDRPIVVERILELEDKCLDKFKSEIEKMDRDGVFLNDYLQRIFYPHPQSYRGTYKYLQNEFLNTLRMSS